MKDCKKIHPLLSLYAEGDLPVADTKRVETHLASCADARQELEHLRRLRKTLLALPEPIPPASLHDSIMGRVTGKVRPLRPHRPFFNFPTAGLAVAACLVLYLVIGNPELLKLEHPATTAQAPAAKNATNVSTNNAPAEVQKDKSILKEVKREAPSTSNYAPQPAPADNVMKEAPAPPAPAAFETRKTAKKASAPRAQDEESYSAGAPAAPSAVQTLGSSAMNEARPRAAAPRAQLELALPTPVPTEGSLADIALYRKISASTWSGDNSTATAEGGLLITDAAQFEAIWKGLRPSESVPAVDFTTQAVVLLNGGEEPSGGYSVKIRQEEETTDQLIIHYLVLPPTSNPPTGPTHPWTLQVIPKPSLPVQFQKD
jgi:hypothetical protein